MEVEDLIVLGLEKELSDAGSIFALLDHSGHWILHNDKVFALKVLGFSIETPSLNGGDLSLLVLLSEVYVPSESCIVDKCSTGHWVKFFS